MAATKKQLVPELRFKEYNDTWALKDLSELLEYKNAASFLTLHFKR